MGGAGSNRHGEGHPPSASGPSPEPGSNGRRHSKPKGGKAKPTGKPGKLVFTIPSDFAAGHDVQDRILADVEKNGFHSQNFFAIKLALEEALVNAIKHGNRLDPRKKVHIEAKVTPGRAEIIIEDEGEGFDRNGVPDPTLEDNLEKCSGRGILLIEAYMSHAEWDRGGRRLRMVKENA